MSEWKNLSILDESFSELTRKERKNLLLASSLGLIVVYMNLIPTKLSMLGIEFSATNQNSFRVIFALVILYFLAAFLVYGVTDFFKWRNNYHKHRQILNVESISPPDYAADHLEDEANQGLPSIDYIYKWKYLVVKIKVGFDYFLPILLSLFAMYKLIEFLIPPILVTN